MSLHRLLSLVPAEMAQANRPLLSLWTETPETEGWAAEPSYGAFVDADGRVVSGAVPARVVLDSDDPRRMERAPGSRPFEDGETTLVFLDWGRQPLSWEEIFELWAAWDSQKMIAGCGAVAVAWALSDRWIAPGWVAFRGDFDGAPLATVVRSSPEAVPAEAVPASFLARALKIRGEVPAGQVSPEAGELPMLPFTLGSLRDPGFQWPLGVA